MQEPLVIAGVEVPPGTRATVDLPLARLYTHAELAIPVQVVNGRRPGPRLFVSAVIHGDEINGVEIIRRLLQLKVLDGLRGALIAVPVVNVYGFINQSRYLPDRRDLNRCFPGSESGSLTSRVASLFLDEIVAVSTHGIDLHTGSNHRANLPQIRACLSHPETDRLARVFGAPVILDANLRDGSLRQAGVERKMPMLLYEAGEALRFDDRAIRIGLRGIVEVMRAIGMLRHGRPGRPLPRPVVARASTWGRAPVSGVLHGAAKLGARVEKGARLGVITDPFGDSETAVLSPVAGIVIGRLNLPLVYKGDALFHVAATEESLRAEAWLDPGRHELRPDDGLRWNAQGDEMRPGGASNGELGS